MPFEPAFSITLGQIIIWYMLLIFSGAMGALGTVVCKNLTNIKLIVGILLGILWYYSLSWLFQSRASMEFAHIFNTVIN